MAKDIFYTALDIGCNKICAILARVGSEGELKVVGTGIAPSQGVQKGRVESISELREAVAEALAETQRYTGPGVINGVYATVSGAHISSFNTKEEVRGLDDSEGVTPRQMRQLIQKSLPQVDDAHEVIHVIPIGYEVDGMPGVRNPAGLHASEVWLQSHIVVGDANILKNTTNAIKNGKVAARGLVLHSLASAEATLNGNEREMGVVLADIGGGTTDISIYQYGQPWYSTVLPVGGSQATRDLSIALRVPFAVAEELKVKWGHAKPDSLRTDEEVVIPGSPERTPRVVMRRDLCEPLHLRMLEIIKLIMLRVTQAGLRHLPPGGLVLTGGAAETPGLAELAESVLQAPARVASPEGVIGLPSQLRKPAFSGGVGALLWGIKHQGEGRPYGNGIKTLRGFRPRGGPFSRAREKAGS